MSDGQYETGAKFGTVPREVLFDDFNMSRNAKSQLQSWLKSLLVLWYSSAERNRNLPKTRFCECPWHSAKTSEGTSVSVGGVPFSEEEEL